MTDEETIRRIAVALPEVEEQTHFSRPGFRVRDKLFASIHDDGASIIANVGPDDAAAAIEDHADSLEEVWRTHGTNRIFVGLRVDLAKASEQECKKWVELAWRNKAPKRLAARLDEDR